jgi:hypothetical protein
MALGWAISRAACGHSIAQWARGAGCLGRRRLRGGSGQLGSTRKGPERIAQKAWHEGVLVSSRAVEVARGERGATRKGPDLYGVLRLERRDSAERAPSGAHGALRPRRPGGWSVGLPRAREDFEGDRGERGATRKGPDLAGVHRLAVRRLREPRVPRCGRGGEHDLPDGAQRTFASTAGGERSAVLTTPAQRGSHSGAVPTPLRRPRRRRAAELPSRPRRRAARGAPVAARSRMWYKVGGPTRRCRLTGFARS